MTAVTATIAGSDQERPADAVDERLLGRGHELLTRGPELARPAATA